MNNADVDYLKAWQTRTGMPLDVTYNADGVATATALAAKFKADQNSFRWLNHTWSHPYLGCTQDFSAVPWKCATNTNGTIQYMPKATISTEIKKNTDWATTNGVKLDKSELVTGEHSGLKTLPQMLVDNPNLAPALNERGIKYVASDASREKEQRSIGNALTVPRYPMNIFYNVATEAEEMDEYNWIYTSRANGGSGICEDNPGTTTCITPQSTVTGFRQYIVPLEVRIALRHVLGNDPRPHYAHQSNLAEDRILYPVLDGVIDRFKAAYAREQPAAAPDHEGVGDPAAAGASPGRRGRTRSPPTSSAATSPCRTTAATRSPVPITMPEGTKVLGLLGLPAGAFGTAYAGERSEQRSDGLAGIGQARPAVRGGLPDPAGGRPDRAEGGDQFDHFGAEAADAASRAGEGRPVPRRRSTGVMDVALINEGTYPYVKGGVSQWCDKLIRGLPEHTFRLVTLVANGTEKQTWELPDERCGGAAVPFMGAGRHAAARPAPGPGGRRRPGGARRIRTRPAGHLRVGAA